MSLPHRFPAVNLSAKIVPVFRLESGLDLHCQAERESCFFGGDFLQGSIGCLNLACSMCNRHLCAAFI